jgi:hypothetical protein
MMSVAIDDALARSADSAVQHGNVQPDHQGQGWGTERTQSLVHAMVTLIRECAAAPSHASYAPPCVHLV